MKAPFSSQCWHHMSEYLNNRSNASSHLFRLKWQVISKESKGMFCACRIWIRSRMWDGNLVLDGGSVFHFNDGAIATFQILPEDSLMCVVMSWGATEPILGNERTKWALVFACEGLSGTSKRTGKPAVKKPVFCTSCVYLRQRVELLWELTTHKCVAIILVASSIACLLEKKR